MAALIPCIDCGHQISSSADKCPKCQSSEPRGVPCRFCNDNGGTQISVKEAYLFNVDYYGHRTYFHPECIKRVLFIPNGTSCLECGISLSQAWNWEELSKGHVLSCKNCGMWDVLGLVGPCKKCRLSILIFHKMESIGSAHYHDFCVKVLREQEQKLAERKQPNDNTNKIVRAFAVAGVMVGLMFVIIIALINNRSVIQQIGQDIGLVIGVSIVGMIIGAIIGFLVADAKG